MDRFAWLAVRCGAAAPSLFSPGYYKVELPVCQLFFMIFLRLFSEKCAFLLPTDPIPAGFPEKPYSHGKLKKRVFFVKTLFYF